MKQYTKPELFFDSFELSSSIAAGCEMLSNHAQLVCPLSIPSWGVTVFWDADACDTNPPEDTDSICYHVPTADNNVFES